MEIPVSHLENIFGDFDSNCRLLEESLDVSLVLRGDGVKISGSPAQVAATRSVLEGLLALSEGGNHISEQNVRYALSLAEEKINQQETAHALDGDIIARTVLGKPIKPKTLGQKKYVDAIRKDMIVFGVGPAGTGKTYLAMAIAISAFQRGEVSRIILTRPAIEAGEKLGFLPGDLQSKIDPYLRPLYDALYEIMGAEHYQRNLERGAIEVAPLAYMRGRTLDNAFIILDEAQNTTPAQMKMFLTRIGFGSKAVITGDETQKDLAPGTLSGLDVALEVLNGVDGIACCRLTGKDVVRHPLVQRIVNAYEAYEARQARKPARGRSKSGDPRQQKPQPRK